MRTQGGSEGSAPTPLSLVRPENSGVGVPRPPALTHQPLPLSQRTLPSVFPAPLALTP